MDLFDPFRKKKKFDGLMQDFFEPMKLPLNTGIRAPLVDIKDRGKFLEVIAELPSMKKKDIDIDINEDSIAIKTEARKELTQTKHDKGYYFHERSYSWFFRKLPLPANVLANRAKVDFKDGILKIEIPKKQCQNKQEKK
jgi:HSP20 family protein